MSRTTLARTNPAQSKSLITVLKHVAFISLVGLSLTACIDLGEDDDDDTTPAAGGGGAAVTSVEESLDAAVDYMDESLPEYGSAGTVAYFKADMKRQLIATAKSLSPISQAHAAAAAVSGTANLNTYWATTTAGELVSPVGGYPGEGDTYPNSGDPAKAVEPINVKEYIGQQLDGDYLRYSGDDEPRPYKPNLFGRFENALEIVKILGEVYPNGLTAGDTTVYAQEDPQTGDITISETEPTGQFMTVTLRIVDISAQSEVYDTAIMVEMGSGDEGDNNWMWLKNTADTLNFQHLEYKSATEDINNQSVTFERTSMSTLRWNRTTGEMGFEYVSFDDDANTQAYGNVMRVYISETDGDAYMMAFEGDSAGDASRDTHQAFSIVSTGGEAATEALVSVNMDITSNSGPNSGQDLEINGSLCASMEDGDEITDGGCTGLSLGTMDVSTSFPAVITNLLGVTSVADIVDHTGADTWFTSANVNLGAPLQFTDETDMHTGYDIVQ